MTSFGSGLWFYVLFASLTNFDKAKIYFFFFVVEINLQTLHAEGVEETVLGQALQSNQYMQRIRKENEIRFQRKMNLRFMHILHLLGTFPCLPSSAGSL